MVNPESHRHETATRFAVLPVVLLLFIAGSASAQQAAGIIGQVTDESGAVLPGVTVTATSPALQVPSVSAVTDEQRRVPPDAAADRHLHRRRTRSPGFRPSGTKACG